MFAKSLYQQIRERFQLGPAYHMTHLDNLEYIVREGKILSYNLMGGRSYFNLANRDVQEGRAGIRIPETGRLLHDYVPLHFGFKTPMVAWNQDHNEDLLFLRVSLDVLAKGGVVFTDGNARAKATRFKLFEKLDDLSMLDVKSILTVKYAHDPEVKRRKQAEILVPDELPLSDVYDIICYSEKTRQKVLAVFRRHGTEKKVLVNRGWYFVTGKEEMER